MIVRIERTVPFPRDAVYAWWTDFREDDHRHSGSPSAATREVIRRRGNEVWLRDRASRPVRMTIEERVILDPPDGYSVDGRYPGATVRYAYRFEPTAEGTKLSLVADVRPRHIGWILVPITRPWWRRYAERDTDFHLQRMVEDLSGSP